MSHKGGHGVSPAFYLSLGLVIAISAIAICNHDAFIAALADIFSLSLDSLGWLYQAMALASFAVAIVAMFVPFSRTRIGGKDAKPRYSRAAWFSMSLTGGIATGVILFGASEPIVYFGNLFGELNGFGIEAGTQEATDFALGRCFYNWSFVPYAIFALSGVAFAYAHYNKKKSLSVVSTYFPLFKDVEKKRTFELVANVLVLVAIALSLAGSLGNGISLVENGLKTNYGIQESMVTIVLSAVAFCFVYLLSTVRGIDKGLKLFAGLNTKVFLVLLAFIFVVGPTVPMLQGTVSGLGYWASHFFTWGTDIGQVGGDALVKWWTLQDFCFYLAYAPATAIFLAKISYGYTIREFMVVNWILPSLFAIAWFGIWGGTALSWQVGGQVDFISVIADQGVQAALWEFLRNLPLSFLLVPLCIVTLILSFSTAIDSLIDSMATMCMNNPEQDSYKTPVWIKLIWGIGIALIAVIIFLFGQGSQGVDAIKYLGSVAGLLVAFLYLLQLAAIVVLMLRWRGSGSVTAKVSQLPKTSGSHEEE